MNEEENNPIMDARRRLGVISHKIRKGRKMIISRVTTSLLMW